MARRRDAGPPDEPGPDEPSAVYLIGPDGRAEAADATTASASRRALGRWPVVSVAAALAVLLVVAIVAHHDSEQATDVTPPPAPSSAAPTSSSDATSSMSSTAPPSSTTGLPPWPTTAAACGGDVPLAVLTGVGRLTADTGVRVLAGSAPRLVDVDAGASTALPLRLAADELVVELAADPHGTVALIASCTDDSGGVSTPTRLVRVARDGSQFEPSIDAPRRSPGSLIAGGDRTWLAQWPTTADGRYTDDAPIVLTPTVTGVPAVRLPTGFIPRAGFRDLVVGNQWDADTETNGPIEVFDLPTSRIVARFGSGSTFTVDNGRVVWADASCAGRCAVHVRSLADGRTRTVTARLEQGRTVDYGAAVSPDGTMTAFLTWNNPPDPHFATDHPGGPTGIAVLDLTTGRVTEVPGVELPPKSQTGLSFAGDGHWLVLTVASGEGTRILMWRPGLQHPVDAGVTLPGPVGYSSPMTVT